MLVWLSRCHCTGQGQVIKEKTKLRLEVDGQLVGSEKIESRLEIELPLYIGSLPKVEEYRIDVVSVSCFSCSCCHSMSAVCPGWKRTGRKWWVFACHLYSHCQSVSAVCPRWRNAGWMWWVLVTFILAAAVCRQSAQGGGMQDRWGEFVSLVFLLLFYSSSLPKMEECRIDVASSWCLYSRCHSVSVICPRWRNTG